MKGKKGDERVLSIYLFIIYIIVSIGVVSGFLLFNKPVDIRVLEANILIDKTIECIVNEGEINLNELNLNCNFDFNGEYFVKVEAYDFEKNKLKESSLGEDYFEYCFLEGENIPQCEEKEIYVLDNNKKILLKIYGVVNKINK